MSDSLNQLLDELLQYAREERAGETRGTGLVLPPATAANPIQNQFHRLKQVYTGYWVGKGGGGAGSAAGHSCQPYLEPVPLVQTGIFRILGWGGGVGLFLPPATAANPIQNQFHRLKQVYTG